MTAILRILCLVGLLVSSGCALLFPTEPGDELEHFATTAPAEGEFAPDFSVTTLDGQVVQLSELVGDRPLVLQLGSHTCPVYRYRRFGMAELREKYADQVDFVVIYTQEAHPSGSASPYRDGEEWVTAVNKLTGVRLDQPDSQDQRLRRAQWSAAELYSPADNSSLVLVDGIGNDTWQRYGAAPSPAFVLDSDGRIILRQTWVEPGDIDRALESLLAD